MVDLNRLRKAHDAVSAKVKRDRRKRKGWVGFHGWPSPFPRDLPAVIMQLPGLEGLPESWSHGVAAQLAGAFDAGASREIAWEIPASRTATEREIQRMQDLIAKLANHVESMHSPAINALKTEGQNTAAFADSLLEAIGNAGAALSELHQLPDDKTGAPRKQAAARLTEEAALVFEQVTLQKPTFTTDPATGKRRGHWHEFLAGVFKAFGVRASADAQVAAFALSEKSRKIPGS